MIVLGEDSQKDRDLDALIRVYQALRWYTAASMDRFGYDVAAAEVREIIKFLRFAYFMFGLGAMPDGELGSAEKQGVLDLLGPLPSEEDVKGAIWPGGKSGVGPSN